MADGFQPPVTEASDRSTGRTENVRLQCLFPKCSVHTSVTQVYIFLIGGNSQHKGYSF